MEQASAQSRRLDVVTIGRCSVDLYGQQIGSRLEDIGSFAKSVGGCPANIAIGAARLGLRSGLITRVGDEQMGHFVKEQMAREGVARDGIRTDPSRLTALVILAVENAASFPLLFYRENCADMALDEDDIDAGFIAGARAIVVTGTHFSRANTDAAQRKAIRIARAHGTRVVFDIDYRPNLWGLAGHAAGDQRYIKSDSVSAHLQTVLPDCDLIVGTEEEVHIAGGAEDTLVALQRIRALSRAVIVLKRGPMGCVVFSDAIPARLDGGIVGKGFPVEVYNVLGAGDAFMSGFLRGWLGGENLETAATWANACGAFAVSRLLCSPEIPTWDELQYFLTAGSTYHALRKDAAINHIHWATTRREQPDVLMALAIDHRAQLEAIADRLKISRDRLVDFKVLAVEAAARVARGAAGYGMLIDSTYGTKAFAAAAPHGFWIGRPIEEPGSRPLDFDHLPDLGSHLVEWPVTHTVKCLCFYHPDDSDELKRRQERELRRAYDAARTVGRELLIEIISSKHGPLNDDTVAVILTRLYELGIKPDFWKLEPQKTRAAWAAIEGVIRKNDPYCRGIVLLGLEAPEDELVNAFRIASTTPLVKGFAVGRTIFADAAEKWLAGAIDDEAAILDMAARFETLVTAWQNACRTEAA
ncbi:MAG TPA: 5-dehydro-2-deoxygluconokinase [Dongiaceae bacterium]|nr:5-dehydro-2-deoxygluconokinase [Dongiaceae bacterium]